MACKKHQPGQPCCDGCNFGCDPCLNGVTITACGETVTFPWPLGGDGCGHLYLVDVSNRPGAGCSVAFPDEITHSGCYHSFSACLTPLAPVLLYTENGPVPTSESCNWVYRLYGVGRPYLSLTMLVLPGRKIDVTINFGIRYSLYWTVEINGSCCTQPETLIYGILNGWSKNPCYPCPLDTASPAYLMSSYFGNRRQFRQTIEYDDCADFWNEKTVDFDEQIGGSTYTFPSPGLNWAGGYCAGYGCDCAPFSRRPGLITTISIPAAPCTDMTATIQFNEEI